MSSISLGEVRLGSKPSLPALSRNFLKFFAKNRAPSQVEDHFLLPLPLPPIFCFLYWDDARWVLAKSLRYDPFMIALMAPLNDCEIDEDGRQEEEERNFIAKLSLLFF